MMENLSFDLQELFEEIVAEGQVQGVNNEEAYHQLVDDTLEDHRRVQEVNDDQNLEGYIAQLKARWPEYLARLSE